MHISKCEEPFSKFCQALAHTGMFLLGASILSLFSIFQKRLLGVEITQDIRAFIVPILFGGIAGQIISIFLIRLRIANLNLKQSNEHIKDFMDNASDLIQSVAPDGKILYTNQTWRTTLGYQETELLDANIFEIIAEEDRKHCITAMHAVLEGKTIRTQFALNAKNGEKIYVDGWINCRIKKNQPLSTRGILRNITMTRQTEEAQRLAAKVFENANDSIFVTDSRGYIITINNAFTESTGFLYKDIVKNRPIIFLSTEKNSQVLLDEMHRSIQNGCNWEGELVAKRKNGETFPTTVKLSSVQDTNGTITNFIGLLTDITARKQSEERLQHLATHDHLTDLPNRALFIDQLKNAIQIAENNHSLVAILFMDLDGFKTINDSHGHTMGDEHLCILAKRLKTNICESDTIARLGGDEFSILLREISSPDDAIRVAKRILKVISEPVVIQNQLLQTTTSIGISIYQKNCTETDLLTRADDAMYKAKSMGKNNYFVYTNDLTS